MTKNTFNALKKNKFHSGHMEINLWKYPLNQLSNHILNQNFQHVLYALNFSFHIFLL